MILAGAASIDITPPPGLAMAGFGVRTEPATGAHDPLTVRAVAVGDTALVAVDVLALDLTTTDRIRARCSLPADRVVIAATHTHGGPHTNLHRQPSHHDEAYMARLEDACVAAIEAALDARRPARLRFGTGADPGVGKNRRHPNGLTDTLLPVVEIAGVDGTPVATLVAYACHPVVLGANNRQWTADYPGFVRARIEQERPGTLAVFFTGCCGDVNTGHSAHASNTLAAQGARTYETAERLGLRIGEAALAAPLEDVDGAVGAASRLVRLGFERREQESMEQLAARWRAARDAATDPAQQILLTSWVDWAERGLPANLGTLEVETRVTALNWAGIEIAALPGELFAETAVRVRSGAGSPRAFLVSMADDNPGYIPPASEFAFGGYEVDEAHRYYGNPATFAPGSAELLADTAIALLGRLKSTSA